MTEVRRTEWEQEYELKEYNFETGLYRRWESLSQNGNKVFLEPLRSPPGAWRLVVPHSDEGMDFWGDDAEGRAFCVADGFIRQQLTLSKPYQEE